MICKCSIVVSVGPGEREPARLGDLLDGLARYEPGGIHEVVIVDDSRGAHDFKAITSGHALIPVRVEVSPRHGKGDGWRGGLATNMLFGLKHAFADGLAAFAVKLDTDSLIIGPFRERVRTLFSADARLGMVGSLYLMDLYGKRIPPSTWKINVMKWEPIVRFRRNPYLHFETGLLGRNRLIRRYLKMALANGWEAGTCAVGGGYAIRREVFDRWHHQRMLADDLLWVHTDLAEDVVVGLLCYAAGFCAGDDNGPGGVFGVQCEGLAFPPAQMIERGYGIIHSVKVKQWRDELALRGEFRRLLELNSQPANATA